MAQFLDDYEAPQDEPESTSFDPVRPGRYMAQVVEADVVDNAKRTGRIMKLVWEIMDGEFSGRKVFQNINFKHDNTKTQEIGRRELDRVVWSCGVTALNDTDDLCWKPCMIKVKIQPAQGQYSARNEIADVERIDGPASSAAPASQQRQQQPQQTRPAQQQRPAAGARPWGSGR